MKPQLIYLAVFGATICGSAFAISTDDRQAFCEQYPDKYVWVEKTQACIPINPCNSTIQSIRDAYCIKAPYLATDPVIREGYIKNVLHKDILKAKILNTHAYAYHTSDGGYLYMDVNKGSDFSPTQDRIHAACWAYGYREVSQYDLTMYTDSVHPYLNNNQLDCIVIENSYHCSDAADFATLLVGGLCGGEVKNKPDSSVKVCEITCD